MAVAPVASKRRGQPGAALPVLWHLKVSNYNEKVRWALDYKGVPHVRRAVLPGRHRRVARELTGESTFPVLVLDRQAIGDSTRIIEALELRHPEPPLYPHEDDDWRRALRLEDFFDEQLGAYVRLLFLHHVLPDPQLTLGAFAPDLRGVPRLVARARFRSLRRRLTAGFGIDERTVAAAFEKVRSAGVRFQAELSPSGYLVGERFSVADLTLAALVAPAVAPDEFPYPQPQRGHPHVAPLRDALAEHGIADWTREMYARHRGASAEVSA